MGWHCYIEEGKRLLKSTLGCRSREGEDPPQVPHRVVGLGEEGWNRSPDMPQRAANPGEKRNTCTAHGPLKVPYRAINATNTQCARCAGFHLCFAEPAARRELCCCIGVSTAPLLGPMLARPWEVHLHLQHQATNCTHAVSPTSGASMHDLLCRPPPQLPPAQGMLLTHCNERHH